MRDSILGGGTAGDMDVLVSVPYTPSTNGDGENFYLAIGSEIGATWGIAYQKSSELLFTSAFMKRHVGFGPLSTGGIYQVDISGIVPVVSSFVDMSAVLGINTGTDPHVGLPADPTNPNHDQFAWDPVGKTSIGDIDISADEQTLWVMNLENQTLYEIFIDLPATTPTLTDVTAHDVNAGFLANHAACTNGEFRPFAVKVHNGLVYIGGVCSAENGGVSADLHAYILAHDPLGVDGNFTAIYDFPIDYTRGVIADGYVGDWRPWVSDYACAGVTGSCVYPQPILADIEFDDSDGAILVGFIDRLGHQIGKNQYSTDTTSTATRTGVSGGELLRVCYNSGVYTLESNAQCGTNQNCGECGKIRKDQIMGSIIGMMQQAVIKKSF